MLHGVGGAIAYQESMTRICSLTLLGFLVLASLGCPSTYNYPSDATGRYCRHRVEDCHDSGLTGADCVSSINLARGSFPASCVALFDAESDCKAAAACSASDACAAEHTAANDCAASAGMGGGI